MLTKRYALLSIFILGFQVLSIAQQVPFSGKVSNNKNETLAGATVEVVETSARFSTDADGRFTVTLEQGKTYSFKISNTGYQAKTISDITPGADARDNYIEIVLDDNAKTNLSGVTVTSTSRRQESTNALLSFQKNNTALSSGLAADFIRRTPDKNTGEVLRRVSGASIQDNKFVIVRGLSDRYNAAFINGAALPSSEPDKKAFSFDIIPSALIDNIVINKTATPDITGEFAGGLVQITTKDIPTANQLLVGFSLGYNTQSTFKDFTSNKRGDNEWLGFSDRKLPANYPLKYGAFNALPLSEQLDIAKQLADDVYAQEVTTAAPIQQYNLTWANVANGKNGSKLGSVLGITYRNGQQLNPVVSRNFLGASTLDTAFAYTDAQNRYNVNVGVVANIAWTKGKHKIAFKNLFNQLLEDNYYTRNGFNFEQDVVLRSSVLNQRSLYSAQLEGTHTLPVKDIRFVWNVNYAYNHKEQPDLRVQTYGRLPGTTNAFALNTRGNNSNRFFSDLEDHSFGYNASAALPFNLWGFKQSLKVGGSATLRLRDFKGIIFGYNDPTDPSFVTLPYDHIFDASNFSSTGFQLRTDLQNPSDKYYGVSAVSAGFIMLDNKLSEKVRLVWGSRFENFEQFLKSNTQGTDKAQIVDTDKFDWLPSVNLTYSFNGKTNLRIAGSRTLARPEFREIADFAFFDFEQIASTSGNAALKRSSIINGDIRYEYYPRAGELLSLGAFYKSFTDPIELRLNSASSPTRRQYQFQNAETADLYGVEAEFRKSLSFITGSENSWLSNLYVNGNLSLIFSEVLLGNTDAAGNKLPATSRPLQGQSPYLINAGFQYDGPKGTNVSLLYNRVGERLILVGNEDMGDIYEKPRDLVDFQLSQKVLNSKGEVKLTVSDIFNQQFATFENRDSKRTYDAGVDQYFTRYKQGTTITLGFNYNFDLKK